MKLEQLLVENWDTDETQDWVMGSDEIYSLVQESENSEEFKQKFFEMEYDRFITDVDFNEVDWDEVFQSNKESDEE